MATVALKVHVWRLTLIAGAEPKCVSGLEVKCRYRTDRRHQGLPAAYHPIRERGA